MFRENCYCPVEGKLQFRCGLLCRIPKRRRRGWAGGRLLEPRSGVEPFRHRAEAQNPVSGRGGRAVTLRSPNSARRFVARSRGIVYSSARCAPLGGENVSAATPGTCESGTRLLFRLATRACGEGPPLFYSRCARCRPLEGYGGLGEVFPGRSAPSVILGKNVSINYVQGKLLLSC